MLIRSSTVWLLPFTLLQLRLHAYIVLQHVCDTCPEPLPMAYIPTHANS